MDENEFLVTGRRSLTGKAKLELRKELRSFGSKLKVIKWVFGCFSKLVSEKDRLMGSKANITVNGLVLVYLNLSYKKFVYFLKSS